jgi:zinc transport system substrate-binding protein
MRRARALCATVLVPTVTVLAACSPTISPAPGTSANLSVVAGFYPLEYAAERVGGEYATVTVLAPPGVEPHDFELSPSGVRDVRDAALVAYVYGLQPSVDAAISSTGAHSIDAIAVLNSAIPGYFGSDPLTVDPHFWLDPLAVKAYVVALGEELASIDPPHASAYRTQAAVFAGDLDALDAAYTSGLLTCARTTVLVSHAAFGHLASRYGLTQVGLSGLDPESEPSPYRIREARDIAASTDATTVFVEPLVDPSVVQSFANDAHLTVAILDPIESATGGADYLSIMYTNLDTLEVALGCY